MFPASKIANGFPDHQEQNNQKYEDDNNAPHESFGGCPMGLHASILISLPSANAPAPLIRAPRVRLPDGRSS